MKKNSSLYKLGAILLMMVMLFGLTAFGPDDPGRPVDSGADPVALRGDTEVYWTAERMANAQPMEMTISASGRVESGKATTGTFVKEYYTYPGPFGRYNVRPALYSTIPEKRIGKLYFTQYSVALGKNANYVCSASVIGKNAIITAGHCLSNGSGSWSTNIRFFPAYNNGSAPYGRFDCFSKVVPSGWHNNGNFEYDTGVCRMRKNGSNQSIGTVLGTLAVKWNGGHKYHFDAFGYPAASPFTGKVMVRCEASPSVIYNYAGNMSAYTIGVGCDMTPGSSGGPWIRSYRRGTPVVYGVNSFKFTGATKEMYSPYFGPFVQGLYNLAKGW